MNENCRLRVMISFVNARIKNCIALNGRAEKFAEALGADFSVKMPLFTQIYTLSVIRYHHSDSWRVIPANTVHFFRFSIVLAEMGNKCGNTNDGPSLNLLFALICKCSIENTLENRTHFNQRYVLEQSIVYSNGRGITDNSLLGQSSHAKCYFERIQNE